MTNTSDRNTNKTASRNGHTARRVSTETKASVKTTELIAYVVVVVGGLWGLAMSGSRDFYDDSDDRNH